MKSVVCLKFVGHILLSGERKHIFNFRTTFARHNWTSPDINI